MKNNQLVKIAQKLGTPIYIYNANTIKQKCKELKQNLKGINLYYACKANSNPEIIKIVYKEGFGIETVSPGEIAIAHKAGVPISKITFTCGSIDKNEIISVAKQGIRIHLDSLNQVEIFGKHFKGREVSVRLNLMVGAGHHSHVITGGPDSKFGIDISQIKELKKLAHKYNLHVTGLHQHIGSNVLNAGTFLKGVKAMFDTAILFPELNHLDFGGGFGVPYRPEEKPFDVKKFAVDMKKQIENFNKKYGKRIRISFEPGRYLVAESGSLLVKLTDIKYNPTKTFVGVNSGMNHLIRPAIYDSYHEIINISNPSGKKIKVTIAGNICESGDVFAKDRIITKPKIGDILEIKNTGAYGYAMSSEYNSRPKPKEFLMMGDKIKRI
ncbi:MAG: diaminopimelate decarboxylase [Candidatus Peregrinibacteria bacterium]|nr:diaminopimelate decarboxylase [Candidatus Peregrinibacteria bacterium]